MSDINDVNFVFFFFFSQINFYIQKMSIELILHKSVEYSHVSTHPYDKNN